MRLFCCQMSLRKSKAFETLGVTNAQVATLFGKDSLILQILPQKSKAIKITIRRRGHIPAARGRPPASLSTDVFTAALEATRYTHVVIGVAAWYPPDSRTGLWLNSTRPAPRTLHETLPAGVVATSEANLRMSGGKASGKQPGTSSQEDDFLFWLRRTLLFPPSKAPCMEQIPQDYPVTLEMIQCVCVSLAAFYL